ncbi:MAG: hypothetical protein J5535_01170 [Firmicutes bacterium]|nr:hypothetical protein [Bacillota bacterium]
MNWSAERNRTVFILCGIVVIILAAVLLVFGGKQSEPPKLTVSNEYGNKISAQRGTYNWKHGSSDVIADSAGPLALYNLGELPGIEASENDDYSLTLKFGKDPQSVTVVIYPVSAARTEDYTTIMQREPVGKQSEYKFSIPSDSDERFVVSVLATWTEGEAYYYFYTTP